MNEKGCPCDQQVCADEAAARKVARTVPGVEADLDIELGRLVRAALMRMLEEHNALSAHAGPHAVKKVSKKPEIVAALARHLKTCVCVDLSDEARRFGTCVRAVHF